MSKDIIVSPDMVSAVSCPGDTPIFQFRCPDCNWSREVAILPHHTRLQCHHCVHWHTILILKSLQLPCLEPNGIVGDELAAMIQEARKNEIDRRNDYLKGLI